MLFLCEAPRMNRPRLFQCSYVFKNTNYSSAVKIELVGLIFPIYRKIIILPASEVRYMAATYKSFDNGTRYSVCACDDAN